MDGLAVADTLGNGLSTTVTVCVMLQAAPGNVMVHVAVAVPNVSAVMQVVPCPLVMLKPDGPLQV